MNNNKKSTTEYQSNVKIFIQSLIIDYSYENPFNLYDYLNIKVSKQLRNAWNSNDPVPFFCEAECTLMSNNKSISPSVIVQSNQLLVKNSTFPDISILHNIKRQQYIFSWNTASPEIDNLSSIPYNVEFPIFYSQLPLDSIISINFYACYFQTPKQKIGTVTKKLFTMNSRRLKTGIYSLAFDADITTKECNILHTNKNLIFRYIRKSNTCTNKCFPYEPYDDIFRKVAELLHPDDAVQFFISLLNPLEIPKLSNHSRFVHINVPPPELNVQIMHDDLKLNPISKDFLDDIYHFSKEHSSKRTQRKFAQIRKIPPLSDIPNDYCNFLRDNIDTCLKDPSLYNALFRSIEWDNQFIYNNVSKKIEKLDPIDIGFALEFFTDDFEIQCVRKYAVRCVDHAAKDQEKKKYIFLYLPQIIQAIKAEYTDGLGEILIKIALSDVVFASKLYWLSIIDDDPKVRGMNEKMLATIDKVRKKEIFKQINLFQDIENMLSKVKPNLPKLKKQDDIKALLNGEYKRLSEFKEPILSPLNPTIEFLGMDPNDVKVFASNKSPVALVFNARDTNDPNKSNITKIKMMFKIGDDIRQDQLILQLFGIMDKIFKASDLDLCITTYSILAISSKFGCMEFVENSQAIKDIDDNIEDENFASDNLKKMTNSNIESILSSTNSRPIESTNSKILIYLKRDNPSEEEFRKRIDTYIRSLAGFSVMTFVLIIGDRHDNNILVTQDGHFLHIDFGFIFGDDAKPLTQPVKIRAEYLLPINTDISVALGKVLNFAGPAFNAVRKNGRLILTLIKLMFKADISCIQNEKNPNTKLKSVQQSLMLNLTEIEAMKALRSTFIESIKSKLTTLYDTIHSVAMMHK